MRFSDFIEKYWRSSCRLNVSDGWKITQDMMLEKHIYPILAHLDLNKISSHDISKVMSYGQSKNHKPSTSMQTYLLLSKIFNDAVEYFEFIEKSPVRKKYHRPKLRKIERKYLSPDEVQKLIEYAKYHWSIQAIVIQIFVGLRAGEVIALRWKNINFEENTLKIVEKWNKKTKTIDNYTKNGNQITVPFSGIVRDFLIDVKNTMSPSQNDFVCTGPDAKSMMRYHSYQKAIRYLCDGAEVTMISSHGFRHTCSTLWRREGAVTDDIKLLFNHESINSTLTYMHDDFFRLRELADKVMKLKVAK